MLKLANVPSLLTILARLLLYRVLANYNQTWEVVLDENTPGNNERKLDDGGLLTVAVICSAR
jgi:hypothetical protein